MEARDFVLDLRRWGLTQGQIAERCGIPQPTISKIERGVVEDVLSRNYRSLEVLHREESAKHADSSAAAPTAVAAASGHDAGNASCPAAREDSGHRRRATDKPGATTNG